MAGTQLSLAETSRNNTNENMDLRQIHEPVLIITILGGLVHLCFRMINIGFFRGPCNYRKRKIKEFQKNPNILVLLGVFQKGEAKRLRRSPKILVLLGVRQRVCGSTWLCLAISIENHKLPCINKKLMECNKRTSGARFTSWGNHVNKGVTKDDFQTGKQIIVVMSNSFIIEVGVLIIYSMTNHTYCDPRRWMFLLPLQVNQYQKI